MLGLGLRIWNRVRIKDMKGMNTPEYANKVGKEWSDIQGWHTEQLMLIRKEQRSAEVNP